MKQEESILIKSFGLKVKKILWPFNFRNFFKKHRFHFSFVMF